MPSGGLPAKAAVIFALSLSGPAQRSALRSRMLTLCQLLSLIELDPENVRLQDEDEQMMRRTALFEGMFVRI